MSSERALFVDLDGTLTRSDVSFESFVALIKKNPLAVFQVLFWLLRGRPYLKREISKRVRLNPKTYPYVGEFVDFLSAEKSKGRKLYLASASDLPLVEAVADHLKIFDGVLATNLGKNLAGKNKFDAIREFTGSDNFAYAGNSKADFPLFERLEENYLVSETQAFSHRAQRRFKFAKIFQLKKRKFGLLRLIRAYQWAKNVLIFLPLFLAHKLLDIQAITHATLGFIAFSLCASSVYVMNDLFDLEADRYHERKKHRMLASAEISIKFAVLILPFLLISAFVIAYQSSPNLPAYLLVYLALSTVYSFKLKQLIVIDIITLALLYTIRIMAGGIAADVYVSEWFMSFSLFFFLSLACLKRYAELFSLKSRNQLFAQGRGYRTTDIDIVSQVGIGSALASILVLALYVSNKEIVVSYSRHKVLWFLCPLMLYWLVRIWLLAKREELNDDPLVFALTDLHSYFVALIVGFIILMAI